MPQTPSSGPSARVVVTGAAGFAGRWLCQELLDAGYVVDGWTRPGSRGLPTGVHRIELDLLDHAAVRRTLLAAPPDGLVHLAALTHVGDCEAEPELAEAINVDATEVLFGSLSPRTRAVYVSTCHVYGPPQWLPMDASHPLAPGSVYARTKLAGEGVALGGHEQTVVARAFHHTGPDQAPRFALSGWAAQLRAGERRILTGDLSLRRDYTDVRDIARGYRVLLERAEAGRVVHLCSGAAPTLGEMLTGLAGDDTIEVIADPARMRAGDAVEMRGDPAEAEALGWRREIGPAQMLADLRKGELSPRGCP